MPREDKVQRLLVTAEITVPVEAPDLPFPLTEASDLKYVHGGRVANSGEGCLRPSILMSDPPSIGRGPTPTRHCGVVFAGAPLTLERLSFSMRPVPGNGRRAGPDWRRSRCAGPFVDCSALLHGRLWGEWQWPSDFKSLLESGL